MRHVNNVKKVIFDSNARREIQSFPKDIKIELGKLLLILQSGENITMPLSRPMPSIFNGVSELRIKDETGNYRIFYYIKLKDKILVFHAFMKKTQKTPNNEIDTAILRLKHMLSEEK
jgi:phage-related protein